MEAKTIEPLEPNEASVKLCADLIKKGGLVIFPTETVYGLGANAMDEEACLKIFAAKGRPANDPLICHVTSPEMAMRMFVLNDEEKHLFDILTKAFWPGPFTIVAPAKDEIPKAVRAGGPTVGVRCPVNEIARSLIDFAGVPIAAPSANRFSHVSPSSCDHAITDLSSFPGIMAIDGGRCSVGIESTVCGITDGQPIVFRRGHITKEDIQAVLDNNGIKKNVGVLSVSVSGSSTNVKNMVGGETGVLSAPGMLTKHYAPKSPAVLINEEEIPLAKTRRDVKRDDIKGCAIIDFGGALERYSLLCASYMDLSPKKDSEEAQRNLFSFLRQAESCQLILIKCVPVEPLYMALLDRMTRATSGCWGHIVE